MLIFFLVVIVFIAFVVVDVFFFFLFPSYYFVYTYSFYIILVNKVLHRRARHAGFENDNVGLALQFGNFTQNNSSKNEVYK